MGTVAAAGTEETAGTERRAVAEMEEVAAVKIVAAEETEEAAVAEIAEAAGDMAGDTEPAAAGDRRVREALRDARVLKDREVHRGFRDLTERRGRLLRQYMHNTEIAVTMRLSTILKTIKQPL